MGRDVAQRAFSREDRLQYRQKVRRCLDVFALMLDDFTFDADRPTTGLEIELNLVDKDAEPAMRNAEILANLADPTFQTELGLFNLELGGVGTIGISCEGQPMLLDCSRQPTFVDPNAAVCWSANLQPSVVNSMNMRSMLRGGTGEAFQLAFHGPGFVVVQPSEGRQQLSGSNGGASAGGGLGSLFE